MSKKSATVLVVFVVAIIAFCLANVVAGMFGTYSLNLFNDDNGTELNDTNDSFPTINITTPSGGSSDNSHSEDVYVSNHEDHQESSESSKPSTPSTDEDSSSSGDHQDSSQVAPASHNN